ncbi:hypothetical protein EV426DRAFT_21295 [Tirmania nivea]|nr:hypothetical protein EV426DRAFT_21295 [Tirmania nivea]
MSFRFNFSNASDVSLNGDNVIAPEIPHIAPPAPQAAAPPRFHTLEELVSTLPLNISYSILTIANSSNAIHIPRRELYDVRMQLMAEDDGNPADAPAPQSASAECSGEQEKERTALLTFINGNEDVRPGVYEGGLKSWECSVDLVRYLSSHPDALHHCSVLELGCGTSLPSLYLLRQALESATAGAYTLHLADYNYSVLRLVTLPNVFLTWVFATSPHLVTLPSGGDLDVTAELKASFLSSLQSANIDIGFISGAWGAEMLSLLSSDSHPHSACRPYDLVLGSETIYEPRTMGAFANVFLGALGPSGRGLVSAKRMYFGVGGSVAGFRELVERRDGEGWQVREVDAVGREKGGVGGVILEVKKAVEARGDMGWDM